MGDYFEYCKLSFVFKWLLVFIDFCVFVGVDMFFKWKFLLKLKKVFKFFVVKVVKIDKDLVMFKLLKFYFVSLVFVKFYDKFDCFEVGS